MNTQMNKLEWRDRTIPHRVWIEKNDRLTTRLYMEIIKDVEPEIIHINLNYNQEQIIEAWKGKYIPISDEYNDGILYSQVRGLINIGTGCVIWMVNHIQLSNQCKISVDRLAYLPKMKYTDKKLIGL